VTALALLGGGVMGEALLAAALRGGLDPATVIVAEPDPARAADLSERHGVTTAPAEAAVAGADTVLVALKPGVVPGVMTQIAAHLAPGALVVSVAAGLPIATYESRLPAGTPVVRVMPNTPALVGKGASALAGGPHATEEHLARAEALLAPAGLVLRVAEKDLDAVTAISGSGPAYVFYLIAALTEAGVLLGLTRDQAARLAVATFDGAATMAAGGDHPVLLRERVSSPGGTTVAALAELDRRGVRGALIDAARAARDRSRELGREAP